jgi:hypothetical protein
MKLKNIIRSYFLKESKNEFKHISMLEKQILARVKEEKELEADLNKSFSPPQNPFWSFRLPLAFATIVVLVLFVGFMSSKSPALAKGSIIDALISLKNQLQQELTDLLSNDPSYRDKNTQKYKQAQQEWCTVSARPAEDQEKAVSSIREFLDRPDANATYECIRNPNENEDEQPRVESYIVDFDRFIIDTETNLIVEMSPKEGSWGTNKDGSRWFSPQKDYDYTPRYTLAEAEILAREFIQGHQKAIGEIDLSKLTLEAGSKGENDQNTNFFFTWKGEQKKRKLDHPYTTCRADINKEDADSFQDGLPCITVKEEFFTPQLSITFTQGGQLFSFINELGD